MAEVKNDVIEIKKNGVVEVNDQFTLHLSRTYLFEGEEVSEIDFSGMDNVTAETMIKANFNQHLTANQHLLTSS